MLNNLVTELLSAGIILGFILLLAWPLVVAMLEAKIRTKKLKTTKEPKRGQ